MNENTPMSQAQQLFAEEHHNLVYAFSRRRNCRRMNITML